MQTATTLLDVLQTAAARQTPLTFVGSEPATWALVRDRALAFAGLLQAQGCPQDARLLIGLPPGFDFLTAFFGAIMAGAWPLGVPMQVGQHPWHRHVEQLQTYDRLFGPWAYVAMEPGEGEQRRWLTVAMSSGHAPGTPVPCKPEDVAFLGLTSGTGGDSKAVMIEHGLLVRFLDRISRRFEMSEQTSLLTWVPYHHASGLSSTLMAMYAGSPVVGVSPAAIATNVVALFQALAEHKATHSFIPSFFLKAAMHMGPDAFGNLDLSTVCSLQVGGERIDPDAVEGFEAMMQARGLARGTVTNCYGMIEATAIAVGRPGVTQPADRLSASALAETRKAEPDAEGDLRIASVEFPLEGVEVRIVTDGQVLGEREVGEIQVRGADVGRAYWHNDEASATRWQDGWLHTGDVGYMADGRLYVCGRLNDVITIAARKFSAEDIEGALARLPEIAGSPVAAVGLPDPELGTEALALAVGVARPIEREAAMASIQRLMRDRFGLAAARIHFTPAMAIPRTATGKVSRARVRQAMQADALPTAE